MKIYNNKSLLNCLISENGFEDFKFSLISSGGGNLFIKDNPTKNISRMLKIDH